MPNRLRILLTWTVKLVGSDVLPEKTSMATGQPSGAHNNPYTICGSPGFPSRL